MVDDELNPTESSPELPSGDQNPFQVEELEQSTALKARIGEVGIEVHQIGKVKSKIINQVHLVIGISRGELYPLTTEDLVVGEVNAKVQRNAAEYGYKYAGQKPRGKPTFPNCLLFAHFAIL